MPGNGALLIDALAADGYRYGNCSLLVYNRNRPDLFSDYFLPDLYQHSKSTLRSTFCGMTDLTAPSIIGYLASRSPLLLMCVDKPGKTAIPAGLDITGYSFPTLVAGPATGQSSPDPGRSLFLGYMAFRPWYRTPELTVCMMLTGAYYFREFNLLSILGNRYAYNSLTAKFLARFGVRDTGVIRNFLFDGSKMVDGVLSCLERADFEAYIERELLNH